MAVLMGGCGGSVLPPDDGALFEVQNGGDNLTPLVSEHIEVTPGTLDFGSTLAQLALEITSVNGDSLSCSMDPDAGWMTAGPGRGFVSSIPLAVTVTVNRDGLADGEYTGHIAIKVNDTTELNVTVLLAVGIDRSPGTPPTTGSETGSGSGNVINDQVTLTVSSGALDFGDKDTTLSLSVSATGGETGFSLSPAEEWMTVSPATGVASSAGTEIAVTVDRTKMPIGDWSSALHITAATGGDADVSVRAVLAEPEWPDFAILRSDGTFRTYSGAGSYEDDLLSAQITPLGDDRYELVITPRVGGIKTVWFPWQEYRYALGGDENDDIVVYPRRLGCALHSASLTEWDWQGASYPGDGTAPIATVMDKHEARTVAALNWPPKATDVLYSRGRVVLRYWGYLAYGVPAKFTALWMRTVGDENAGDVPWHPALDSYREWLVGNMTAEGLYPIAYPDGLKTAHGWMQVLLHYDAEFDVSDLEMLWDNYGHVFPWLQCWGQMSNYQYSPGDGLSDDAVPPLEPGEEAGCCLMERETHPRYLPAIREFGARVAAEGGRLGFYARPTGRLDGSTPEEEDLFLTWIATNEADGANAQYFDVLGGGNYGDALTVARYIDTVLPRWSSMEFAVDLYPVAFMISGVYFGGYDWSIGPGYDLDDLGPDFKRITFPRYLRYLLDDRIMFLGASNGDRYWWGEASGHHSYTERKAFLMGAKFDAPVQLNTSLDWPGYTSPISLAVALIVSERDRVGWWEREPHYRDRQGISHLPEDVDVRKFIDNSGVVLLCVDNWFQHTGQVFYYNGTPVPVPTARISILEMGVEN